MVEKLGVHIYSLLIFVLDLSHLTVPAFKTNKLFNLFLRLC